MDVFGLSIKIKEEGAAATEASIKRLSGVAKAAAGLAGIGSLTLAVRKLVSATADAQFGQAQLAAALRSTGGAAGQTIGVLNDHASALQKVSIFGDEAINKAQGLLLTFTKIQGDTFPKATEAVLNVATAMGTDLQSAAIQVGKALNDPILGVTALARSGIQFTQVQKDMIKTLVETGQQAKAQTLILQELEVQFGGSAAAARDTLGGALAGLRNAFGDLFEVSKESSQGIIAAIEAITASLPKLGKVANETFLAWGVLLVDIEIGLARISKALAESNLRWAKFLMNISGAKVGVGLYAEQIGRLTQAETDLAALEVLKIERQKALAAAGIASPTTPGAPTVPGVGSGAVTATKEELDAVQKVIEQHYKDSEAALVTHLDNLLAEDKAVADVIAAHERAIVEAAQFQMDKLIAALQPSIKETLSEGIAGAIEDGFIAGITGAIATGRIADAWKMMGQAIIQNIASAMVKVALTAIKFASLMQKIRTFMVANPALALASAAAMLAFAYANGGQATGTGVGVSGGRGGAAFTPMMGSAATGDGNVTRLLFGQTSATTAAGMQPRTATNVTIIGPDDPKAQRAIEELLTKGNRRGTLG